MTKRISDSERLTIAALNRREAELKEAKDTLRQYQREIDAMKACISSLKESNQILCGQLQYLVSKYAKQNG